ncbi:hypothetical protein HDV06_004495 [Boothiomyces sp. JEL0866]|nr:hypothetical protein HDV06_004495 [Boothiomyces sp. JEL0866]
MARSRKTQAKDRASGHSKQKKSVSMKKSGAGKGNWGKAGDEISVAGARKQAGLRSFLPTNEHKMATHREGIFVEGLWVEKESLDSSIPHVDEVGATSAPLLSMAYFFGSACKEYSEDFVLCKNESQDPRKCLKEGRKGLEKVIPDAPEGTPIHLK